MPRYCLVYLLSVFEITVHRPPKTHIFWHGWTNLFVRVPDWTWIFFSQAYIISESEFWEFLTDSCNTITFLVWSFRKSKQAFDLCRQCLTREHGDVESPIMPWNNAGLSQWDSFRLKIFYVRLHPHHTALLNADDSAEHGAVFSSHGDDKVFNFPSN